VRPEGAPALSEVDILLFHGNAGDRSSRLGWMHLIREGLGCSVTVIDYRGYGGSDGRPTERGLIADGAAALEWLARRQQGADAGADSGADAGADAGAAPADDAKSGGADRRLVVWGESIGSGVAVALLGHDGGDSASADSGAEAEAEDVAGRAAGACAPIAGLGIESGFSSCLEVAASAYPFLPRPLLRVGMLDQFQTARRARRLGARAPPALFLHGDGDEIAPIELGLALYDALPARRKRWVELEDTGHNDVPYRDPSKYLRLIRSFLREEVLGGGDEAEGGDE